MSLIRSCKSYAVTIPFEIIKKVFPATAIGKSFDPQWALQRLLSHPHLTAAARAGLSVHTTVKVLVFSWLLFVSILENAFYFISFLLRNLLSTISTQQQRECQECHHVVHEDAMSIVQFSSSTSLQSHLSDSVSSGISLSQSNSSFPSHFIRVNRILSFMQ